MVYDVLAPFYDRIMCHVNYEQWVELVEQIVHSRLRRKNARILELGGGTGMLGALLREEGFAFTGSDRSFGMCRIAAERRVPFFCADARRLPLKTSFDLVLFLYDGINYLPAIGDYTRLFKEVGRCLMPGGFFLFDITTEANSITHFCHYLDSEEWNDGIYIRRSHYDPKSSHQHNDFTIFRKLSDNPPLYERLEECHRQKVLDPAVIAEAVPQDIFSIEGIWDGFTCRPHRNDSNRIHFLLKRSGA